MAYNRHYHQALNTIMMCFIMLTFLIFWSMLSTSHAEVTSDGTMGTSVQVIGSDYTISQGTITGNNQFHSFAKFNVDTNKSATFTGPNSIANIIGRVTGGTQSWIDGLLRSTIDGANLFLLNPAGVLFGQHASLDVKGSFHVSTADYLLFEGGKKFYVNPSENSILSVASPAAFGFLSENPAGITIQGSMLGVPEGETLSVVGGNIEIVGHGSFGNVSLSARSGRINIASVASPGEVIPNTLGETSNLQVDSFEGLGEITLSQGALVDTSGDSGGTVVIRGGRLLMDNAFVLANTQGDVDGVSVGIDIDVAEDLVVTNGGAIKTDSHGAGNAGDIEVSADDVLVYGTGNKYLPPYTGIFSNAYDSGSGGDLYLTSSSLEVTHGAVLDVTTLGSGNGGNLNVTTDSLKVTDNSSILAAAYSTGNAGNTTLTTGSLELRDASGVFCHGIFGSGGDAGNLTVIADSVFISGLDSTPDPFGVDMTGMSTTAGPMGGSGGNLRITADSLTLTNRAQLDSSSYGPGQGGVLEISTDSLQVLNGSNILASTFGTGDGGNIEVEAGSVCVSGVHPEFFTDITGQKSLSPSGIASQTGLFGGSAGDIRIKADSLELLDGGRLGAETFGPGDAGTIEVVADSVLISGINADLRKAMIDPKFAASAVLASTYGSFLGDKATGKGGDIRITAGNIQLRHGGLISSETQSPGVGGSIELAGDNIMLSGGASISATSRVLWSTTAGEAGKISITAQDTFLSDNSSVTTAANQAEGGPIGITAKQVQLVNGTLVSTESSGAGNAGNIHITAMDTFLSRNSAVTTEATQADGGNIKVSAEYMVHLIDSEITASVGGGHETVGGNINIDPEYVILNDSKIIANAFEGMGGNIDITADVFLADPNSIVDASSALGIDGQVDIRAPITEITGTLAPLPKDFRSALALLREPCMARIQEGKYSSFVIGGRDGLPLEPGGLLPSPIF